MGKDWLPEVGVGEVKKIRVIYELLAEMIGTMVLVFFSCGSAAGGNVVRYSLTFGFTVATMAQAIGHVSGCHINPAVTLGLFVGKKIGLIKSLLYIVAQCIGSLIGAALLLVIQPPTSNGKIPGITHLNGVNAGQGFLIEFVITFVLVLTVYAAAGDESNKDSVKGSSPLAIGLAITIAHLFAGPLTGPSMNPARSLGPAIVGAELNDLWVYWVGPILGGVVGGITYQLAFQAKNFKAEYEVETKINDVEMK